MADAIRDSGIVFSRQPDPNFLSVAARLDHEAWAADIRKTLEVTHGAL
ncbi:MAG: hypothetical protein ACUVWX_10610 [Kiritimatiellia bacterium]